MTELDYLKGEQKEIGRKIELEKEKEQQRDTAKRLRGIYDAMIEAGFSEEQAWWFLTAIVEKAWGVI